MYSPARVLGRGVRFDAPIVGAVDHHHTYELPEEAIMPS